MQRTLTAHVIVVLGEQKRRKVNNVEKTFNISSYVHGLTLKSFRAMHGAARRSGARNCKDRFRGEAGQQGTWKVGEWPQDWLIAEPNRE